ncbi:stage II sporulation protein Q [Compostibacillus humi]|uniref:Stage II sporulation protein Q n=1 Tax=Compostibacillus humi TaxID=1245525 RepID=A0A8J2ZPS9_9BACI|nr:M23 family metallopeptidase [Compostibacillus humi]GGH70980.1 stage II sporulation protein Q [Compostibacillus humi]
MNEEKRGSQKRWSRIFRKKWFFPALYLSLAALLIAGVIWYQNLNNEVPDAQDAVTEEESEDYAPTPAEDDAVPVVDQQEVIQMPVANSEEAEIVTKFYDYNASQEDQENALVFHNNRYYQSTGIDISSSSGDAFDVVAAISGTVMEVKEDPLLGNVVILDHGENITTYYASLGEVTVNAGDEVKQGEKLGTAGKNRFGQENGNHVHFEIRKDGVSLNPESFLNQPVSSLAEVQSEKASEEPKEDESEDSTEDDAEADEANTEDDDNAEDEE